MPKKNFDYRRCGTNHKRRECPAFNKMCKKIEDFGKICRTMKKHFTKQKNRVNTLEESSSSEDDVYISVICN